MYSLIKLADIPISENGKEALNGTRASMRDTEADFDHVIQTLLDMPNFLIHRNTRSLMHVRAASGLTQLDSGSYHLDGELIPDRDVHLYQEPRNHLWRELSDRNADEVIFEAAKRMHSPINSRQYSRPSKRLLGKLEDRLRWFPDYRERIYVFDDGKVVDINGLRAGLTLDDHVLDKGLLPASDPDSTLPLYNTWLNNYEGDRHELERALAYMLFTTHNPARRMFLFWGYTSGGKSVGLNILRGLMNNQVASWDARSNTDNFALSDIASSWLLAVDEVGKSARNFPLEDFKRLSSGSSIRIRLMRKEPRDHVWDGVILMTANDVNGFPIDDPGALKRLCAFEFTRMVPEQDQIADLGNKIVDTEGLALLLRLQKIAAADDWKDMGGASMDDVDTPADFLDYHFGFEPEPTTACLRLGEVHSMLEMDSNQKCPGECGLAVPYIPTVNQNLEFKLKSWHMGFMTAKIPGKGPAKYTNMTCKMVCGYAPLGRG